MKKLIVLAFIITVMAVCTSCTSINELLGRTISEKKIESYLNDSIDAVAYLFAYDPNCADKSELDSDFKVRSSAATYKARTKDIASDERTYLISETEMKNEIASVFANSDITDFENNDFVSQDAEGTYHLLNGDWGDAGPVFRITDAFYGLNGSEPTRITVHYTLSFAPEEGDMSDTYDYEVQYTLIGDSESPYTFKISDIKSKNLIPVANVKEISTSEPETEAIKISETETETETETELETENIIETLAEGLPKEESDGKGDVFFSKDEMPYVEIIEKYRQAIAEGWDAEDYTREKMSFLFRGCETEDEVGFCLKYMDDSTYPWLFIGTIDVDPYLDDMILDAYSLDENGNLVQQFSGWERNRYYYIVTGEEYPMIANEGSSSAALSDNYYFDVKDGQLKLREGILYDGFTDEQNPWFYIDGLNTDLTKADAEWKETVNNEPWPYNLKVPRYTATDAVPVTEDKAFEITEGYTAKYRRMDFRPLSEGYEILDD